MQEGLPLQEAGRAVAQVRYRADVLVGRRVERRNGMKSAYSARRNVGEGYSGDERRGCEGQEDEGVGELHFRIL